MNKKLFSLVFACLLASGLIFISCSSEEVDEGSSDILSNTRWVGEYGNEFETLEFQTNNRVIYDGSLYLNGWIDVRVSGTYIITNNMVSCHFQGSMYGIAYNETWNFELRGNTLTLMYVQNTIFNPNIGYVYTKM